MDISQEYLSKLSDFLEKKYDVRVLSSYNDILLGEGSMLVSFRNKHKTIDVIRTMMSIWQYLSGWPIDFSRSEFREIDYQFGNKSFQLTIIFDQQKVHQPQTTTEFTL